MLDVFVRKTAGESMGGVDEKGKSLWLKPNSVTATAGVKLDVTSEIKV